MSENGDGFFRALAPPAKLSSAPPTKRVASSLEVTRGKGFAVFHPTPRQRRGVGGVGG
jgi:hypothetical protein